MPSTNPLQIQFTIPSFIRSSVLRPQLPTRGSMCGFRCSAPANLPLLLHLLHLLLFLTPSVHPQPSYLVARVVHRSSSTPLRHRPPSLTSSSPLRQPSSSIFSSAAPPRPSPSSMSSFTPLQTSSSPPLSSEMAATSKPGTYQNIPAARPSDNATEIGPFSSDLITLNQPFGQYFAVMKLGSPASEIVVIIDTGSEITWVQCEPCLKCGSQIRDPIFDPSKSHSYRKLQCNSNWCRDTTGLAMGCQQSTALSPANKYNTSPTSHAKCFYNATYGDNSVSYGDLSADTLTFPSASGDSMAVSKFIFGCGYENSGVETDFYASGLMGLDRGSHSIISQLRMQKFAYCLPERSHNMHAAGFVVFGNYNPISNMLAKGQQQPSAIGNADAPPPMQYAKLLLNNKSNFYAQSYYVNLTGIQVGKHLLNIPLSLFEIDAISGYGGTIIDTGTSLTSLVDMAYAVFQDAVRTQVSGDARPIYIPELPSFDNCYTVGSRGEVVWPEIRLQFDGGTTEMQLPERNMWLQVGRDGDRNLFCLAFAAAGEGLGGRNVIGNFQQQNFLVEFDVARARIGFAYLRRCSSSSAGQLDKGPFVCLGLLLISVAVFFLS